MSKRKNTFCVRAASVITAALVLAILFFSSFYIALESYHTHHDCSKEECPVCICIQTCQRTLHQISDGSVNLYVSVLPVLLILFSVVLKESVLLSDTPVSRKVRMND